MAQHGAFGVHTGYLVFGCEGPGEGLCCQVTRYQFSIVFSRFYKLRFPRNGHIVRRLFKN